MKKVRYLLLSFLFFQTIHLQAQNNPVGFDDHLVNDFILLGNDANGLLENVVPQPPPLPVRMMAEWEELEAIVITFIGNTGQRSILREIVRYAREEVNVIIVCSSASVVQNFLNAGNVDWSSNVTFVEDDFDTIWVRDFGPNTVYANEVGEKYFIDWIYNRPRPLDDKIPDVIGELLNVPIYSTTEEPLDLVHTGGNFMSDGMGTAFSFNLVLDENDDTNTFGYSNHSESAIDSIMNQFMGIEMGRYIKMGNLLYDPIDHIDMHIKLLDEETLLVGEFPEGVADGPQMEANLKYVLDNFTTPFGNPYHVIRIPMPPENGNYPDTNGDPRTYANALIVNKMVLVPFYEEQYDTTAQRIWEEAMPGYKIQGINCNAIIGLNGAIHCITKEVGVSDPLLINHAKVREGCSNSTQTIEALIQHQSGIASANLFFTIDTTQGYLSVPMTTGVTNHSFVADIPQQAVGTEVFYYIQAEANSGKTINRPIPAPVGYFHYSVVDCTVGNENVLLENINLESIYPNPASAITVIPVTNEVGVDATIEIVDVFGKMVRTVFEGKIPSGDSNYFIHANEFIAGTYFVLLKTERGQLVQKLVIR